MDEGWESFDYFLHIILSLFHLRRQCHRLELQTRQGFGIGRLPLARMRGGPVRLDNISILALARIGPPCILCPSSNGNSLIDQTDLLPTFFPAYLLHGCAWRVYGALSHEMVGTDVFIKIISCLTGCRFRERPLTCPTENGCLLLCFKIIPCMKMDLGDRRMCVVLVEFRRGWRRICRVG